MFTAIQNSTHIGVRIHAVSPTEITINPINIAILLDTSGSMEGDRIDDVRRTLRAAKELFHPSDTITLVTFGHSAKIHANYLKTDAEGLDRLYDILDNIKPEGSTNLSEGIDKLLRLSETNFDGLLLLTDGVINSGITSICGLRTLTQSLVLVLSCAITTIGYGADHNRTLLRDIAVNSRGAYICVDSESKTNTSLPAIVGDLISGIHMEVIKNVTITVPFGLSCIEPIPTNIANQFFIGNIVPDRDYWVIYKKTDAFSSSSSSSITITGSTLPDSGVSVSHIPYSDCHELQEQILRCRVACALNRITECVGFAEVSSTIQDIQSIQDIADEIDSFPEDSNLRMRPLVIIMRAQLADVIAMKRSVTLPPPLLLARILSGAATLSSQRSGGDPTAYNFSSTFQNSQAHEMVTRSTLL